MSETKRKRLIWLGAIVLALLLFAAWVIRGNPSDLDPMETTGREPRLVDPDPERIPSISLVDPVGWGKGEAPKPAAGLAVTRFAEGLNHPRTMLTLPNGDVLVAETNSPPRTDASGVTGFVMRLFLSKVGAGATSPNRIVLLRDGDGDGTAEQRFTLRTAGLDSPSGMAWGAGKLYVANHNAVLAFDFVPGATELTWGAEENREPASRRQPLDAQSRAEQGWQETLCCGRIGIEYRR